MDKYWVFELVRSVF